MIHDYFITKTLDKVRPGGIVAFITTKGTMDKDVYKRQIFDAGVYLAVWVVGQERVLQPLV